MKITNLKNQTPKFSKTVPIANVAEWEKQVLFYRSHLDIFIEEYFSTPDMPVKLFPFQKVIARACGNCEFVDDVESRSLGKTYKMALILSALAILYPQNHILVVSKTSRQALLVVKYIEQICAKNSNLAREIQLPIKFSKDVATVTFKSGTILETVGMAVDGSNIRGLRKKIIYIDESGWVKTPVIKEVLSPMLQYKRDIFWKFQKNGFKDVKSKLFQTTSAYLKSCDFYDRFIQSIRDIKNGDTSKFACALNYMTGVKCGIIDESFVEEQKRTMPISSFQMEWNAKFIGTAEGSFFDYELTEACRTLEHVEVMQPKSSKSRYIISLDIATSAKNSADNASIAVIKFVPRTNGIYLKQLVNIRTYHGYKLEKLAEEVRKYVIRFPNVEKIVIDINAIGEGILSLLNMPYVDENNKEYLPLTLDEEINYGRALPIIRGFRANNSLNARMATAVRLSLENKSLEMPIPSSTIRREFDCVDKQTAMLKEEVAIYIETDALQFEMGNIIPKVTGSGVITYDVANPKFHKDRYTSIAMGIEYIYCLEEETRDANRGEGDFCIGQAFEGW